MIIVLFTPIIYKRNISYFQHYLDQIPLELRPKILRYSRWQDAHASLFGKLLLKEGLSIFGLTRFQLEDLRYTTTHKPYISDVIDFNISHSGDYVIFILSDECKVGIDIEEINPISLDGMEQQWTDHEWQRILNSPCPQTDFYHFWTKKEALLKASGVGLTTTLSEIDVIGDSCHFLNKKWWFKEIFIAENYETHIVTDAKITNDVIIQQVNFI